MVKGILGVDIGGVIIDRVRNDGTDTAFKSKRYLETTAIPGVFLSLAKLRERFNGEIFVVSKAGLETELKTRDWLNRKGFYDLTGINPGDVHYCRERKEKAPICEWLGITHFIDDRLEVLSYLYSVPNKYLFGFQDKKEIEKHKQHLSKVVHVESWKEVLRIIK